MVATQWSSPVRRNVSSNLAGRLATGFSVLALCAGVLVLVPVGSASARTPPVDAAGTVTCTGVTGSVKFVPPLRPSATSTGTVEVRARMTGCAAGGTTNVSTGTFTGRIRGTVSLPTDGCPSFAGTQDVSGSLGVSWTARSGRARVQPSTISLARVTGTSTGGDAGLEFLDQSVGGSFSGQAIDGELTSTVSAAGAATDCSSKRGLRRLAITGGLLTSETAAAAPIVCTGVSQTTAADPIVVTGCQPPGVTGGSGDLQGNVTDTVLTWNSGDSFQLGPGTVTSVSPSPCPSGTAEVDDRSTVTGASGTGTGPYVGAPVAYDACLSVGLSIVVVELVPGTSFTIG